MVEKKKIQIRFPLLQINVEVLTVSKFGIVERLATQHNVTIILLQVTHCQTVEKLVIKNYKLAGCTISRRHGLDAFVRNNRSLKLSNSSGKDSDIDWQCINVESYSIINICKPPPSQKTLTLLLVFDTPCIYADDFNCQDTHWE